MNLTSDNAGTSSASTNPPSELQEVPSDERDTETTEETLEPESKMPAPETGPEQGAAASPNQTPEPVAGPVPVPVPITPVSEHFLIFSFCHGSAPKVLHAFSRNDVGLLIRDLAKNEDQFLFVVRGGELAHLFKTKQGLVVQFDETKERIKIPFAGQSRPIENGWIGNQE